MINEVDFELADAQVRAKKMGLRILTQTVEFPSMPFASFHKVTVFSLKRECNALIPVGDDNRTFPVIVNVSHVSRSGDLVFVKGEDLSALGFYGGIYGEALGFWIKDPLTGEREIEFLD